MPDRQSIDVLSSKVISYLQKCFPYAVKQHKNDLVLTKANIQKIIPNCFEDQVKCDEKWCRGNFDASYKHNLLPYGKHLCGKELKKDRNRVIEKHAKNADTLSPSLSGSISESFNIVVVSKAPKMNHYSK